MILLVNRELLRSDRVDETICDMSIEPIKNYKDSLLGITLSFLSNIVILDVDHDVSAT